MKTFKELDEEKRIIDAIPKGVRWRWVPVNMLAIGFCTYAFKSFLLSPNWTDLATADALWMVAIISFFKANYNGNWLVRYYTKYPETLWLHDPRIIASSVALSFIGVNALAIRLLLS